MDDEGRQAFNQGCDARLEAKPLAACPYNSGDNELWYQWKSGWKHVDQWWGQSVLNRWTYRVLPIVQGWKL